MEMFEHLLRYFITGLGILFLAFMTLLFVYLICRVGTSAILKSIHEGEEHGEGYSEGRTVEEDQRASEESGKQE